MSLLLIGLLTVWMTGTAWAQTALVGPSVGSTPSGFDMVSEWKCTDGKVTLQFDNGAAYTASYGILGGGLICGNTQQGGTFLLNWHQLGDGTSTFQASNGTSGFAFQFSQATQAGRAASVPILSLETRLRALRERREQKLITPEEYYEQRSELLKEY